MATHDYRPPKAAQPENVLGYLRSLRCYLDAKGVSRVLKCHQESVYLLIAQAGLPAEKRGRRWRIDPILFADWLEATGFASAAAVTPVGSKQKGTNPTAD